MSLIRNTDVVKANALMNAGYVLDISEQRIILLAIILARNSNVEVTADTILEIPAQLYAECFNMSVPTAYMALRSAEDTLFERRFTFEDIRNGEVEIVKSRWVSRVSYVKDSALLTFAFAPDVIPLISKLESNFSKYALDNLREVKSKYAIRLYELAVSWRNSNQKRTPIYDMEDFRIKMGLLDTDYRDKKYPDKTDMTNFNKRVLKPALDQINTYTDLKLTEHKIKTGKFVTGIYFDIVNKDEKIIEVTSSQRKAKENGMIDVTPKKQPVQDPTVLPKVSDKDFIGSDLAPEDLADKPNPVQAFIMEREVVKRVPVSSEQVDEFSSPAAERLFAQISSLDPQITKDYIREFARMNDKTIQAAILQLFVEKQKSLKL